MERPHRRRRGSRRPEPHPRPVTLALVVAVTAVSLPAAAAVNASYFTFADSGGFIDGDGDYSMTRSRAVVDSGFVHQPVRVDFSGHTTDWVWQAKASASLATGTLRAYTFSDTTDSGAAEEPPAAGGGWRTQATANWTDVVTFAAPANPPAGPPVPVTFRLDVRGNFAGFYAAMTNTSYLMVNGMKSQVDFAWDGRLGPAGSIDATATTLGTVTGLSVDPHQLHGRLEVTVAVMPGDLIAISGYTFAKAAAGPYASATSDFDHTATLSIDMPTGYTFTSQSGVLLSVPEPSTWLSMFAGLGVLAASAARRRGGTVAAHRSLSTRIPEAP